MSSRTPEYVAVALPSRPPEILHSDLNFIEQLPFSQIDTAIWRGVLAEPDALTAQATYIRTMFRTAAGMPMGDSMKWRPSNFTEIKEVIEPAARGKYAVIAPALVLSPFFDSFPFLSDYVLEYFVRNNRYKKNGEISPFNIGGIPTFVRYQHSQLSTERLHHLIGLPEEVERLASSGEIHLARELRHSAVIYMFISPEINQSET